MDTEGLIVFTVVGLICIFLGYLIWFKKMLFLIAGYNESTFEGDKEKLAKGIGIVAIISGIVTILFPFFLYLFGNTVGITYCLIIIIGLIVIFWIFDKK
ncbi:DUF3784 domain-containing protein [Viridibacillus sp. YIM B01967]|uniref:DUF3784 domain-containing protein n=1 Tax=Viridibacillus soli TaxID=2798301 RepID=A0ABS1H736_9BACL|nr:DUF3784 domain-containing protein [Viridibacillus soli]MBK3495211.1 DUF3784 domain-containing protein [Viridibacillus soli]